MIGCFGAGMLCRAGHGSMTQRFMSVMIDKGGLKVDSRLVKVVKEDIAPGTGIDPEHFWSAFGKIVLENAPKYHYYKKIYIYAYIYMYIFICIYVVYICIYIYMYVYICIYMYI